MSKNKAIIVKKIKKVTGGGHHGGAWKVAYADFVTAMMAFFLLMWLLNMTSDEKRARLSTYFKYFSIYDSGGTSWMGKSSEIFGESGENAQKVFANQREQDLENSATTAELNSIEESLKKDIAEKLSDVQDQILVDVVDEGVRIQMIDKEGSLMFERGNTNLTPKAKEVLKLISADIKKYPNKVIIEGHTDSVPYAGSQYSNWELSTERASSARKELEATGLDPKRITRVAGYADTDPLIKDNKQDPRNRRISITLGVTKMDAPRRNTVSATPTVITSDEKQLKKVSEDLRNMIDNSQISTADEKKPVSISHASTENNKTGEGQPIIKKQEWPAFRPVEKSDTLLPDKGKSSVIKNTDYDSMIREGQTSLKNGNNILKNKVPSKIVPNKALEESAKKNETKGPSVIKELSEPVIGKDKLFTIIPGGR